jgi:hypothetical protein
MGRYRLVVIALCALAVTGCTGTPNPPAPGSDPSTGGASPSSVASGAVASATPSPTPRPVSIADAEANRLIQAGDVPNGRPRHVLSDAEVRALVTLPCASAMPASDAQVAQRNGMAMEFSFKDAMIDSGVREVLTLYRSGGAAAYMSELTAALAVCATDARQVTRTVMKENFAGDASVLFQLKYPKPPTIGTPYVESLYLAAIRAGDVVMVLEIGPYESGGGTTLLYAQATIAFAIKRAQDS